MSKNTLWFFFVLLVAYLALVFCEENVNDFEEMRENQQPDLSRSDSTDLFDEARTRRRHRHHLLSMWGIHALAIAFWIKVKVVIVSFFVGSAVFVGLRYVWPHKCSSNTVHEGPIIYENPHSYSHHDHIPYSLDHSGHFDHSSQFDHSSESGSFEPYSAYAGSYHDVESVGVTSTDVFPSTAPNTHRVGRRSVKKGADAQSQPQRQKYTTEEQIAEVMFSFLGLDSDACRRRFICEMEFRSKLNPLTSMAFRIVGRGFFAKYTNARNQLGRATSFVECAAVNPECMFIEENMAEDDEEHAADETEIASNEATETNAESVNEKSSAENDVNAETQVEERENAINLEAERRGANIRRRGDRQLDVVAGRILTQAIHVD